MLKLRAAARSYGRKAPNDATWPDLASTGRMHIGLLGWG